MLNEVMKQMAAAARWPWICIKDGQAVIDVEYLPHSLRNSRGNRESMNVAADALEVCTGKVDALRKELTAARRAIRAIKREQGKYDPGRDLCIKADKRITQVLTDF